MTAESQSLLEDSVSASPSSPSPTCALTLAKINESSTKVKKKYKLRGYGSNSQGWCSLFLLF